ncbi:MAG: hypothetical protein RJA70_568 [Pseudomonadota bacterium]|jgi:hypothetical protein
MAWALGWFAQSRVYLITAAASLALGHRCAQTAPPEASPVAVALALGRLSDAHVVASEFDWEPSRGPWLDAAWGRGLLFLGTPHGEGQRDLFCARARVSPEGQPIVVSAAKNLTETSLADEEGLQVRGRYAVYRARAFDEIQGVSLLDLGGARSDEWHGGWLNRWLLRLRAWQETGSFGGVSRTHIATAGASQLLLRLGEHTLELQAGQQTYGVDLATRELSMPHPGPQDLVHRVVVAEQHQGGDQWRHTLVDLLRTELGAEAIAWLEGGMFGVEEDLRRLTAAGDPDAALAPAPSAQPALEPGTSGWPPTAVPSLWASPHKLSPEQPAILEGVWQALADARNSDALGEQAGRPASVGSSDSEPLFVHTFVHPDRERPAARLWLIAMDMRRLELRMEAGYEEPRPETGPPGRGSLPVEPALLRRVVATFNGGFKSVHGDYGMMVDGRVLVPPTPGAATVVVTQDGRAGLGNWPLSPKIPADIVSFRQNLQALLADGKINPTDRQDWGPRVVGQSAVTERSALCMTEAGELIYAWGSDVTGATLAQGLKQAGCRYAMALDMNPGHTGFFLTHILPPESGWRLPAENVQATAALEGMRVFPKKYALWSDKDFFYLLRRGDGAPSGGLQWTPSVGLQPLPAATPAILSAARTVGTLPVELLAIEPGRMEFALSAGNEPLLEGTAAPRRALNDVDAERELLALTLGHATLSARYGLAFGESATLPLRDEDATLLLGPSAEIGVVPAGEELRVVAGQTAVQLPSLLSAGEVTTRGQQRGPFRRRGALCVADDGRIYVAMATNDSSDVLALALGSLGCRDVVELDRGSNHEVTLTRAGTPSRSSQLLPPPEQPGASDESTTLHGLSRIPTPWTFRFGGD